MIGARADLKVAMTWRSEVVGYRHLGAVSVQTSPHGDRDEPDEVSTVFRRHEAGIRRGAGQRSCVPARGPVVDELVVVRYFAVQGEPGQGDRSKRGALGGPLPSV